MFQNNLTFFWLKSLDVMSKVLGDNLDSHNLDSRNLDPHNLDSHNIDLPQPRPDIT